MVGNSFLLRLVLATTLFTANFGLVNETHAKNPELLKEISVKSPTIPDTVYTKEINTKVLLDGYTYEGAQINYTLLDTINNTQELIRTAYSNANGEDIIDSLPILKDYTKINENEYDANKDILITNNGQGSNHLMRIKTDAESITKEGYIFNSLGQQIATLKLDYNPSTKIYNAVWNGEQVPTGLYTFITKTSNGIISEKILHLENTPTPINKDAGFKEVDTAENNNKSGHARNDDLAASKYANEISDPNLETLLDTTLLKEDTYHDLIYNVTGKHLGDGEVQGWIYFEDLTGQPSNADVEYKRLLSQSEIYNTTATNGFYEITVPVVYEQQNPDTTKYLVTLSSNTNEFITQIDTVSVITGPVGFVHYVQQILPPDATLDIEGVVRHVYTNNPESGVTVRMINRTTGELMEEVTTNSAGEYSFLDIAQGTLVEFELGKVGEIWSVNKEFDVPSPLIDTVKTLNRQFVPSTVEVPEVGTNSTIQGTGEEISEMYGDDYINFEEVLRDVINHWANGPGQAYWTARTWGENNLYEGNSPVTTVNTQRNITSTMQSNYDPYTNFYPGQLGWNINFGGGNLTLTTLSNWEGHFAILGGEIMTTGGGSDPLAPILKELYFRTWQCGNVNSRPSVMNATSTMPDQKDRAYLHLTILNQDGRFDNDYENYSLEDMTSTPPTMRSNEGQGIYGQEKALSATDYVDTPGHKPHSKENFNQEKFNEQKQAQREEQVRSYLRQQLLNKKSIEEPDKYMKASGNVAQSSTKQPRFPLRKNGDKN